MEIVDTFVGWVAARYLLKREREQVYPKKVAIPKLA